MDDEVKGSGNSVNYKYRMHDPRIGRFFAIDPLAAKYPHNSVYAFSENIVTIGIELEGAEHLAKTYADGTAVDNGPDFRPTSTGSSGFGDDYVFSDKVSSLPGNTWELGQAGVFNQMTTTIQKPDYSNSSWTTKWSLSESWYGQLTYNIVNDAYLATADFNPWAVSTPGIGLGPEYFNLGGIGQALPDRSMQGINTLSWFMPAAKGTMGLADVLKYAPKSVQGAYLGIQMRSMKLLPQYRNGLNYLSKVAGLEGEITLADNLYKLIPEVGYVDVLGHGNPNMIYLTVNGVHTPMTIGRLSNMLTTNGLSNYPIRLASCNTGVLSNGYAQKLANAMGQKVIAPNGYLHVFPNGMHSIQPFKTPLTNWVPSKGSWVTFHPK